MPVPVPSTRRVLSLCLLWAACVWTLALVAARSTPWLTGPNSWSPDVRRRATPLARWDSGWYMSIAASGYMPPPKRFGEETNHAFFPLYPLLMRAAMRTTGLEASLAGNLVSLGCFLGAAVLFARWVGSRWGPSRVTPALLALLAFPTSFFFLAVYTEALVLFLALLAADSVDRDRPLVAAFAGYLSGLTRISGVVLGPYLALSSLLRSRGKGRGWIGSLGAGAVTGLPPLLGFATFCAYFYFRFGDPFLFATAQHNWGRAEKSAWDGPILIAKEIAGEIWTGRILHKSPARNLEGVFFLLFAFLAWRLLRERRWPESLYTFLTIGLVPFTGTLESAGRYVLPAFPGFPVLGSLASSPRLFRAAVALGFMVQAAYVWIFVHWLWAG
jgi:hypothetical protein